jgi:hypothetical protein
MTEAEWQKCDDPQDMLEHIHKQTSRRKLRLFAVACCRRVIHLLPDDKRFLSALAVAEQYADRKAGKKELSAAHDRARAARSKDHGRVGYRPQGDNCGDTARWAAEAVVCDASELPNMTYPFRAAAMAITAAVYSAFRPSQPFADACKPKFRRTHDPAKKREHDAQVHLVRDLFGNPFRTVTVDPAWLAWNGRTIRNLAEAIYNERAFDRMPILADALEDAGCNDADILDHLRGPGPHSRGCWPLDLLLDKK